MKYRYKDQSIDVVVFDAEMKKEIPAYAVKFPYQDNEVIYQVEDFENKFELVQNASMD